MVNQIVYPEIHECILDVVWVLFELFLILKQLFMSVLPSYDSVIARKLPCILLNLHHSKGTKHVLSLGIPHPSHLIILLSDLVQGHQASLLTLMVFGLSLFIN